MAVQDLKHHELTEKIIGCAMKVHRHFGPGFPEVVYKRALIIELNKIGIPCKEEVIRDIIYEGKVIHKRRLDLLVEDIILLELKALKEMDNAEVNQILNYLRVFKIEVGLLLNFGTPSLFFKRFIHTVTS
ncbi:MAG TPA: GxxExxY protein [Chitinophagaceae bacterium]|nr:GxxExxY protein [Chitinophagaceae bacterium]